MISAARQQAFDAYARAAIAFTELVARLKDGEDAMTDRADADEAVRDLVEFALARPTVLIETVASVRASVRELPVDYHARHAANTCVYSLLLGVSLGLSKMELGELGTVALFADLGLAMLPMSRTQSAKPFTNAERRDVRCLMMQGVQVLFGTSDPSTADARLLIAAYEHHAPYRSKANDAVIRRHPYSRIVAVADVYDALRAPRPWRNPFLAIDAFRSVWADRDSKFDPVVVEALRTLHAIEARDDSAIAGTEVRDFVRLDTTMSYEPLELDR